MPECFGGTKALEERLKAVQERTNERFTQAQNEVSDIQRTLTILTQKLEQAEHLIDALQGKQNRGTTRDKHKASTVLSKFGEKIGIIKPHVYQFNLWLDYVRTTRTERLIRKAIVAERAVTETRVSLLHGEIEAKTAEIRKHTETIKELDTSLKEVAARPTNAVVLDRIDALDNRFSNTEEKNAKFLGMIDTLAKNVSSTVDRLASSQTDHIDWVIAGFAGQLKRRNFRFDSAEFSLGGIPGFILILEISGASESATPLPGSVSIRVACRTPNDAELELVILDRTKKFKHRFDAKTPEICFFDLTTVARAYDPQLDSLSVGLSMISLVSKIPVSGGHGTTIADLQVASASANSLSSIRTIVAEEISAFQESMASVAEWRIEDARNVCSRHMEIYSSPFRLQGIGRVVVSLSVDKIDETATVRVAITQPGIKSLKLSVNVGSHSRVLEMANVASDKINFEKRKFCKVYPEIENISDSLLVVVRVFDVQFGAGSSGSAIQVRTHRGVLAGHEDLENGIISNPSRSLFIPPLNESTTYEAALLKSEQEDQRISQLQLLTLDRQTS